MRNILVILLSFTASFVFAQFENLVPNGSFEEKTYCPTNFNQLQLKSLNNWTQTGEGTPDHFSACSEKVGVPKNLFGNQAAQQGESYAGMAIYSFTQRNYREYLQTKLTRPLNKGEMVCIEMYIACADFSKYVIDGFGIALTEKKIAQERTTNIATKMALSNPSLIMLDETDRWMLVSDTYIAEGGEEYITIGNFKPDRELKVIRRTADSGAKDSDKWAYVFVDNVSVKTVQKREMCSCENDILKSLAVDPPLELQEYFKIQLDAVRFDFDQSSLTDTAIVQLKEIAVLLLKNKAMYIEVDGHTDGDGTAEYNNELSRKRAQAVIDYLVNKGIESDRLTLKAFGMSAPAASNATEEGKAENRRVEFQILQKKYELVQ